MEEDIRSRRKIDVNTTELPGRADLGLGIPKGRGNVTAPYSTMTNDGKWQTEKGNFNLGGTKSQVERKMQMLK